MKILNISIISLFSLFNFLIVLTSSKKQQKQNSKKKNKYDEISSIYNWASKNGIYINPNLSLNKNAQNDIEHIFYYFKSNNTIKNNTLLLKIPSSIIMSQKSLEKMFKNSKDKKLSHLWKKVSKIDKYLEYSSSRQLFYISVMLSHSTFKQKGKLYKKYKEYLDMYDYINLDDYPIFFKKNEMAYLNSSNFGKEIRNNLESINNEYYLIKHVLGMDSTIIVEEYIKYRILSLANSIYYKNVTYIIPFIDCFQRKVNYTLKEYNAYIVFNKTSKGNNSNVFNVEIYSNKTIGKNKEISILWKQVSNSENYLYYGFIDENNMITPTYLVDVLNSHFLNDLNISSINKKYNINFEDIIQPKYYDLNTEFYEIYLWDLYRNLSMYFDQYYHSNEGPFIMIRDNLKYYLNIYKDLYNDDMINKNINGRNKRKCVKNILGMERKLVEAKLGLIEKHIKYVIEKREERDVYEVLRRTQKLYKNSTRWKFDKNYVNSLFGDK